jgi:hypothetical protein
MPSRHERRLRRARTRRRRQVVLGVTAVAMTGLLVGMMLRSGDGDSGDRLRTDGGSLASSESAAASSGSASTQSSSTVAKAIRAAKAAKAKKSTKAVRAARAKRAEVKAKAATRRAARKHPPKPAPTTAPRPPAPAPTPTTAAPAPPPVATPAGCARGGSALWNNLAGCGWAGPGNTGYRAGTALRNTSGRTISANGAVISNEKITGRVRIRASNVTIRNSWVISTGGGTNGTGVIELAPGASATIDHVTIDGGNNAHACIWHAGAAMTAVGVNCSRVNDGIFSWQDSGGTSQGNNFTIRDSYFHGLTEATGNGHIDGYQTEGARNGVIRHNTFDISSGQNAAVSIWDGYKSSDNIAVDNNLMTGGGFTVYAEDYSPSESSPGGGFTVTNVRITNNRFSTRYFGCVGQFGVWFSRGAPTDGWHRSGNTVLETGQRIDSTNPTSAGRLCT